MWGAAELYLTTEVVKRSSREIDLLVSASEVA
jgi:hypothetical protein